MEMLNTYVEQAKTFGFSEVICFISRK